MDVRIARPADLDDMDGWLIEPSVAREAEPVAFVRPFREPEVVLVVRLNPITAHRVLDHEGLHVVLFRLGERGAAVALDRLWVRRRVR